MRFRALLLLAILVLGGCAASVPLPQTSPGTGSPELRSAAERAARNFVTVVERVEPVAEQECRARTTDVDCDFRIFVDDRASEPPNAFQTVDRRGRPVVIFTLSLIADARNQDELAFILGHEAAHHIAGHIPRAEANAQIGAEIFSNLAAAAGQSPSEIDEAAQIGAAVGARRFAREFELEADRLGTIISARAGFDPVRGAQFFDRVPDPGDRFLGTHPPNAERQALVRQTAASLR